MEKCEEKKEHFKLHEVGIFVDFFSYSHYLATFSSSMKHKQLLSELPVSQLHIIFLCLYLSRVCVIHVKGGVHTHMCS